MSETSGATEDSATAYAAPPGGGRLAAAGEEVWLRGNVRPVAGAGAAVVAVPAVLLALAAADGLPPTIVAALAAVVGVLVAAVAAAARVAWAPRLARRGPDLLLRLSPWRVDAVPLEVVECVFPGSLPLAGAVLGPADAAADGEAGSARRVATLVIRFAERAAEWRSRPTFAPWGAWHDGHAVLDGRWCEPLSAETARRVGELLLEARREAAAGTARAGTAT